MTTRAIVLSGGGSKGDFEVGALNYLYGAGIRPDLLCTTSVGSVNGLKLAEGETGGTAGLAGLTNLWLSLTNYSDFFQERAWMLDQSIPIRWFRQFCLDFAAMNPPSVEERFAVNEFLQQLRDAETAAVAGRLAAIGLGAELEGLQRLGYLTIASGLLPSPLNLLSTIGFGVTLGSIAASHADTLSRAISQSSLFDLGPLEGLARANIDLPRITTWATNGGRLRMAAVALESGALRYVSERGQLLNRNGEVVATRGAVAPPECQQQADAVSDALADLLETEARVANGEPVPGGSVRVNFLRRRLTNAQSALTACLALHPQSTVPVDVDLISGMIASATMPSFFPPRLVNGELYVDGGIRAVLPVEPALQEGADRIYAIQASKPDVDRTSTSGFGMAQIALRSLLDIAINELALRDAHPPAGFGSRQVDIIEPRIDIHTTFTVYPAFVRNRMAYGWMCAADVIDPPAGQAAATRVREIADRIAVLRYGVARLECWVSGMPLPPTMITLNRPTVNEVPRILEAVRALKDEIRTLVAERAGLGGAIPSGSSDWDDPNRWSFGAEVHPWNRDPVDNSALSSENIPLSVSVGAVANASISFFNVGNTTWRPTDGYRLGAQGPQDNLVWGLNRVELPDAVNPGQEAVFNFSFRAPPSPGRTSFEWQMVRDGVQWFGERSARSIAIVPAGEPAECADLRARFVAVGRQISMLIEELTGDDRRDRPIRERINRLREGQAQLLDEGRSLGCTL
jgi:NTE family protein